MLSEKGAPHIKIFGGGGGTILPEEIKMLQDYGIERIYHPDDGRTLGLQGMINDLVERCDYGLGEDLEHDLKKVQSKNIPAIARTISAAENFPEKHADALTEIRD